eukprot:scaffold83540_cov18-Tisochrysis_lutea.AAC.1
MLRGQQQRWQGGTQLLRVGGWEQKRWWKGVGSDIKGWAWRPNLRIRGARCRMRGVNACC